VKSKSNAECNSAYGGRITSDMLCANGVNNAGETTDACQGDSGGPLVCDMGSGRFVLHGATSWGYGCASAQYPGVWARISHELGWIHSYIDPPAPGPSPSPVPTPSSTPQPTSTELTTSSTVPQPTSTELTTSSTVPSTSTAITTTTVPATTSLPGGGDTCHCECVCQCPTTSSSGPADSGDAADGDRGGDEGTGSPLLRGGSGNEASGTGEVAASAGVGLAAVAVLGVSAGIGFVVGRRSGRTASRKDTE